MEEEKCFHAFMSMITSRPHIAENIVKRLITIDIVNCLKTCHDFRRLIVSALRWSQQLQAGVNEAASNLTIKLCKLDTKEYGPLQLEVKNDNCPGERFSFGVDGSVWLFRHTEIQPESFRFPSDKCFLTIYDLQENETGKTFPLEHGNFSRPNLKILPNKMILLQKNDKTVMFSKDNDRSSYEVLWEDPNGNGMRSTLSSTIQPFYGNDCIYQVVKADENNDEEEGVENLLVFFYCGADRPQLPVGATRIKCQGFPRLKEGHFVMTRAPGGIAMFDSSSGNFMWNWQQIDDLKEHQMFLTETFCGLLYADYLEETEYYSVGHYKLLLLDTRTGQEIYHDICWDFDYESEFLFIFSSLEYGPKVFAKDNYLIACSRHKYCHDIRRGGATCNTFICVKVNPKDKTCKVRHLSTGLDPVVLRRSLSDYKASEAVGSSYENQKRPPSNTVSIAYEKLNFLGAPSEGVVIGEIMFSYHAANMEFLCTKTVFSMDLDMMMEMYEPASMFSAVNFPLGQNVLVNSKYKGRYPRRENHCIDYCPYYDNCGQGGQVSLTGILEIFNEPDSIFLKLYYLRRSVDPKICDDKETVYG